MLDVTITGWAVTVGLVLVLLAIDLTLAIAAPARRSASARRSCGRSSTSRVAIGFGLVFASIAGWDFGGEYFAGYIVEKSLSVDNLFVFVVIMTTFAVPAEHQQKVLIVGIVLALVLRVIFIAARRRAAGRLLVHVPGLRAAADRHRRSSCSATATRTPPSRTTRS